LISRIALAAASAFEQMPHYSSVFLKLQSIAINLQKRCFVWLFANCKRLHFSRTADQTDPPYAARWRGVPEGLGRIV
jgi:hypothetical protein